MHKLVPYKETIHSLETLASASINEQSILLHYKLVGDIGNIFLPELTKKYRKVQLWEATCFEFFIQNPTTKSYYEFNFSPSGEWNCFFFKSKGDKLQESECTLKEFKVSRKQNLFEMSIEIALDSLLQISSKESLFLMNLTAVLEIKEELTYWAFEHGNKSPNFHDFNYYKEIKKSGNKP